MGQWLSERLGQQILHREPAGRGQQFAAEAVVSRRRTAIRCFWSSPRERDQCDALRQAQLQFHARHPAGRDIKLALRLSSVVHPSVPAKTVPSSSPTPKPIRGKINMASAAPEARPHMAGELFKMMAESTWCMCPIAGRASDDRSARRPGAGLFDNVPSAIDTSGPASCAPLAVTTAARSEACRMFRRSPNSCRASRQALVRHHRARKYADRNR